ncbi:transglycosylase domain-containing protein [Actinomyces sp.]
MLKGWFFVAPSNANDDRGRRPLPSRAEATRRRLAEQARRDGEGTIPKTSASSTPSAPKRTSAAARVSGGASARTGSSSEARRTGTQGASSSSASSARKRPTRPQSDREASAAASRARAKKGPAKGAKANKGKKKRSLGARIGRGILFTFLGLIIAGLGTFLVAYAALTVPQADQVALAQTTTVYYADGTTEMGRMSQVNRKIIDSSTLPDYVAHAVVASEDRTFYTNSGVDLKGIGRALVNNIRGGARQGASTLTQQYVERYYVGETTGYVGKAKEAILALKINREQSKDQIIGNYLNTIYFGRGAYGIEAASQAYFGHEAKDLTLSEAAMIAGIIPAPSAWDPAVDEEKARSRWTRVINLMVEDGWISQADANAAEFPKTIDPDTLGGPTMEGPTGYLMEQIRTELAQEGGFTTDQLATGGYRIISTIDKEKQDQAVEAAEYMYTVRGWNEDSMHVALTSLDPATGEIVAEYGGKDYLKRQQNGATQDIMAAGSTFKPFALIAHAEQGGSIYDTYDGSSPKTFSGLARPVSNDSGVSWGRQNLVNATKNSINTVFVGLNQEVGSATTKQVAIELGIPEDTNGLDDSLLNVLGFAAPHNIDLAHAYSTIASGGQRTTPHIVREVQNSDGSKVFQTTVNPKQVFDTKTMSTVLPALQAVTASGGTAEAAAVLKQDSGGKTGTSEEQKTAQFVGFTPSLVTAVSMYQLDENGSPVSLTNIGGLGQFHGGDWPVTVWVRYMKAVSANDTKLHFDWYKRQTATPVNPAPVATTTPTPTEETPTPTPEATQETPGAEVQPTVTPSAQNNGGNGGNGGGSNGGGSSNGGGGRPGGGGGPE